MITPLLLVAALTSPPAAAGDDCVEVLPTGLRGLQLTGGKAHFDLVLSVERSCGMGVTLKGLDYRAAINGVEVTTQTVSYDGIKLKKGQPAEVLVPVELDAGEAARLALAAFTKAELSVALSGEANVRWFIFPLTMPFDEELVSVGL